MYFVPPPGGRQLNYTAINGKFWMFAEILLRLLYSP